jgi:hypothetical protein
VLTVVDKLKANALNQAAQRSPSAVAEVFASHQSGFGQFAALGLACVATLILCYLLANRCLNFAIKVWTLTVVMTGRERSLRLAK